MSVNLVTSAALRTVGQKFFAVAPSDVLLQNESPQYPDFFTASMALLPLLGFTVANDNHTAGLDSMEIHKNQHSCCLPLGLLRRQRIPAPPPSRVAPHPATPCPCWTKVSARGGRQGKRRENRTAYQGRKSPPHCVHGRPSKLLSDGHSLRINEPKDNEIPDGGRPVTPQAHCGREVLLSPGEHRRKLRLSIF